MERPLPEALLHSLRGVAGFREDSFVKIHQQQDQVVSVRFNPSKISGIPQGIWPDKEAVPWSSLGYYLPQRPVFAFDPLWHAGMYYVQEASGMFLEQGLKAALDLSVPARVLDLCAAPGGKSTLLQSFFSADSLIVCNEVIKPRAAILAENMTKWGAPNTVVTTSDPADWQKLPGFFDVMLVDAPCSGSGLFRRDAEAIGEWSESAVELCCMRQQRILEDAWPALREGGLLLYSTCSYSAEENEQVCDWMMKNFDLMPIRIPLLPDWGIVESESEMKSWGYRFYPDRLKGEGLFVACFRKQQQHEQAGAQKNKRKRFLTRSERAVITPWLQTPEVSELIWQEEEVLAFPAAQIEALEELSNRIYVKRAGIQIGKIIRGQLLPAHPLAVSTIIRKDLAAVEAGLEEALAYLRKEEVKWPASEQGWMLVKYLNTPLGWLKMLKNRSNNYYPSEWRLLKSGIN